MNNVIIINGASCSGKSTICRTICEKSNHRFVHLQIDKVGTFFGTIFPKGFKFAENEVGTENNDDGLKGLYNNNRFARRKIVAGICLATANELISKGFDVVIDTALDGPDAKELAKTYLDRLQNLNVKFVGIDCPLKERLKRLKTRTDNLFLTKDFLEIQENLFNDCKEFYDIEFDSSKMNSDEIADKILLSMNQLH